MIYIALESNNAGKGDTLQEAFDDLKEVTIYHIDIEEITFYKCEEIKVKQSIEEIN